MRKIKFRAWDNNFKKMAQAIAIDWYDNGETIMSLHLKYKDDTVRKVYFNKEYGDDIELLQYTGLKDKNGKEIYEGDIIEYKDYSGGAIIFGGEQPKSKGVIEIENLFDGVKYLSGIGRQKGPDVEIIGNIYENPELLED